MVTAFYPSSTLLLAVLLRPITLYTTRTKTFSSITSLRTKSSFLVRSNRSSRPPGLFPAWQRPALLLPARFARSVNSMSTSTDNSAIASSTLRFVDIGANLLEERFTAGIYRGTFRHEPDLDCIIERAVSVGITKIILTAGTVAESRKAVQTARQWNELYPQIHFCCTVGVHPTRCQQVFENNDDETSSADELLDELLAIARDGMTDDTVVAIGEIGLDYDRLEFCPKPVQHEYFKAQLQRLAKPTGLPLFLHNRSVGNDLYNILKEFKACWKRGGVVHSFDDTLELATMFIADLQLYIGLNGCSLRTDESLAVAKALPLDHILLETDCPYCEVRKTHPGYSYIKTHWEGKAEKKFERGKTVKSRQEPCHIVQVAEIVAGVKEIPLQEVSDTCYENSLKLYGWTE